MGMGPCLCGATDCPSCGPAQGYTVVKVWKRGRWHYVNPDDDEEVEEDVPDEPERDFEPDDRAADAASDRYERDIERNYP